MRRWLSNVLVLAIVGAGLPLVVALPAGADQASDYAALVTADGANPYYRLDDTSTTGATAQFASPSWAPGHDLSYGQTGAVSGDAAEGFNGTSSTAAFCCRGAFAYAHPTAEAWFRPSSTGQTADLMAFQQAGWGVSLVGGYLHAWVWQSSPSHQVTVDGPRLVTANAWHHVALVEDGTQLQLFLDGIVQGAATVTAGVTYSDNFEFTLGSGSLDPGNCVSGEPDCYQASGPWFSGLMDEVALYDHALTHAQLELHVLRAGHPLGPPLSNKEIGVMNAASILKCVCAADPVNTQFGNLIEHATDVAIAGRGAGLAWSRSYNSLAASTKGRLGYGWSDNYGMHLTQDTARGTVTISQENGAEITFVNNQGTYVAPSYMFATLTYDTPSQTWTFTRKARSIFTFGSVASGGKLTSIRDLNGNATTLAYDGSNRLATATDAAGRTLTFAYTNADTTLVTGVTDTAGSRSVAYGYDGSGNLTGVTDVRGKLWTLGYDGSHRLLTVLNPLQQALPVNQRHPVTTHYDTSGRVDVQTDVLNHQTAFAYQSDGSGGQNTTITDPDGHVRTDHYDNQGLLVAQTRAPGSQDEETTRYAYDPATFGVATESWARGATVLGTRSFTYSDAGNVLTRTEPGAAQPSVWTYDTLNDVMTAQDPNQVTTTYGYDANGNVTSAATPLVGSSPLQTQTITYHRDDASHKDDVTSITDPNHTIAQHKDWLFTYNAATGTLSSETDPLGNKTSYGYDAISRRTSMISPKGTANNNALASQYTTSYLPDAAGNLLTVIDPLNHITQRTYDDDGNLDHVTDPSNHLADYDFNVADQLTQIKRPDSPQTTLQSTYYDNGALHTQVDGANQSTTYTYNAAGELASTADPLGRTTSYGYDGAGNRTSIQNPGGNCASAPKLDCVTFAYLPNNLLNSISYSDGVTPNVAYTYDADGQRQTMTTATDVQRWDWDSLHHLTDHIDHYGAGNAQTIAYTYFLAGQTKTTTYPGAGHTVTHDLWDNGQLKTITDWSSHTTQFTPDANGNLATEAYPNAVTATYTSDAADRLMGITDTKAGTTLAGFSYSRDNSDLLTGVTSTVVGTNETYDYTPLDQLKTVNGSTTYTYDAADNLTKLTDGTRQGYDIANELCYRSPTATGTCAAPPADAIKYSYDAHGNRIQATPSAGVPTAYSYDQAERLTKAKVPVESGDTGQYKPLTMARVLDTRAASRTGSCYQPNNTPVTCATVASSTNLTFQVGGFAGSGVPTSGVEAVVLNVTAVNPAGTSNLVVFPSDVGAPGTRDLSFTAGQTASNAVIAKLGPDGRLTVRPSGANTDVVVDVEGYYESSTGSSLGGTYTAIAPTRMTDSRTGSHTNNCPAPTACTALTAGSTKTIDIAGLGGVPATGASAVVLNLTVTNTSAAGYAQVYPADVTKPNVSNTNFVSGDTVTEMVVAKLSADGKVKLFASGAGFDYFIDVEGWFSGPDPDGSLYVAQTAQRLLNTGSTPPVGTCTPSPCANLTAGYSAVTVQVTGKAGVPSSGVTAVSLNLSAIGPSASSYLLAGPTGGTAGRTVSFAAGENTSNAAIVKLNTDGTIVIASNNANVQVLADVTGWYEAATNTWTYAYDGDGTRTTKTAPDGSATNYTWDKSSSLPLLLTEASGANTTYYIYGPGGLPLEDVQPDGTVRYYHHDQLGSTRMLTNQAGSSVGNASYDSYGKPTTVTGATAPLGYAGQYTDAETGLQYLRARYYQPTSGSFLTRDPADALTRSAFAYATGNPLGMTDPSGLSSCGDWSDPVGAAFDCAAKAGGEAKKVGHAVTRGWARTNAIMQVTGVMGVCVNAALGVFGGGVGSVCLAVDKDGNFGLVSTGGLGGEVVGTANVSGSLLFSNADSLKQLEGRNSYVGGSAGEGVIAGGDIGLGEKPCGDLLWTFSPSVGAGADLGLGPIEGHAGRSSTDVEVIW